MSREIPQVVQWFVPPERSAEKQEHIVAARPRQNEAQSQETPAMLLL